MDIDSVKGANLNMLIIDKENWKRREHYEHYRQRSSVINCTALFDFTQVYQQSKRDGIPFQAALLYALLNSFNHFEQFRYRIVLDEIACYDEISACTVERNDDGTFYSLAVPYHSDIREFYINYKTLRKKSRNSGERCTQPFQINSVGYSALPSLYFTSINRSCDDMVTAVGHMTTSTGKTLFEKDKVLVPCSVTFNHALLDGIDFEMIAKYIEHLEW